MRPARRLMLSDDVYEAIRGLLMDSRIPAGGRVNIDALARQLAVSPTPVREALARLEADGLVVKRPLAGYTAAPLLTRRDFEELFEMRRLLECATARAAASRFASGELGKPDSVRLRAEAELPGPPPRAEPQVYEGFAAFTAQDARFHGVLAELSGNRMLHDAVVRLRPHLHLFRLHFPRAHYGTSTAEHHAIVDAVLAGDAAGAEQAMGAHLAGSRARHLPFFDGEG